MNDCAWSAKVANAVMKRYSPYTEKWCYENGLVLKALEMVWAKCGDEKYYNYIKESVDKFVNEDGSIRTYAPTEYNIDHVNAGKVLFMLLKQTGDKKYEKAAAALMDQLATHPRTSEGGFWHKKIYPNQMWLDGLYMASPFYAQYTAEFGCDEGFDDVAKQIIMIDRYTRDAATGLLYHGWDESRVQKWANPETGCSPNFWGRAMGWYAMAIVDVLEFLPQDHSKRQDIVNIFTSMVEALMKYQDEATGMWYQVLDQGGREGNYLETSGTAMFVYAIAKAARLGLIKSSCKEAAKKAFNGIVDKYVETDSEGLVSLKGICKVAGLGGNPYRDGSFEYYISEPVVADDYKGVGPFIMAAVEIERM